MGAALVALATTIMLSSCLVTSSPTFEEPVRSAPVLVADRADPDPRRVLVLDSATSTKTFSAFAQGEDAGQAVEVRLFLDYGWANDLGRPFRLVSPGADLQPATASDDPRPVSVTWTQGTLPMQAGCHRLTLMLSHRFDDGGTGCPVDPDDYDQITWTVLKCDALGCPEVDLTKEKQADDDPACPPVAAICGAPTSGAGGGAP